MRPIVNDRVAWSVGRSVCLSVCLTSEPCKNGCTDRDAVWVEDSGGPREPCIRWGPVLSRDVATATIFWLSRHGVHIGATWRIRLNRQCAAAMRPYVKLLWPLVFFL